MRLLSLLAFILTTSYLPAQALIDRAGTVVFFSDAIIEDITATNRQALGALDPNKGTVAVSMLMRGFKFQKSLMEEHFNENYVESEKFPKATFKGTIEKTLSEAMLSPGTYQINATGELTIHGVTKPLKTPVTLLITEKEIKASGKFLVKVADHDIKVPTIVIENIAEEVEVSYNFTFQKPAK